MTTIQQKYLLQQETAGDVVNGMDFQQGNILPLASLLSFYGISTNQNAGIYYVPASNKIVVKQNGATLNGYNFSGVSVQINANNVTIENCTFNDQNALFTVRQIAGFSGMTVQNCTFNGGDNVALAGFVQSDTGYATVSNNTFIDTPSHAVQIPDGVVSDNSFFGAGFQTGSHADAICVENTTGPVLITGNYVDWTNTYGGVVATNNAIRITTDIGNVSNVTVTNNVLLGGQDTVAVVYGSGAYGPGVFSNVSIYNNFIGDYVYSAYYPQDPAGVTLGSYTDVGFDNPALSAAAWFAYQSNSIQVNSLVTAAAGQTTLYAAATGSTMLYGAGVLSERLDGGTGETILIGGASVQNFSAGAGQDIFTFLAIADSPTQSPDYIGSFNASSDVIDLHALNANPAGTFTNFTFIGSAPFSSAGGEVQVTQDVANNQTLVEADLVGDSSPDLMIRLNGLVNLTAANFALTTAQYENAISPYTTTASFDASQALLDQVPGGFSIVDTVTNVQSDLTDLQADAANIDQITVLGGSMTVDLATMSADQPLLNKIMGGYNIADTAANVQLNLAALQADVANIDAITATGGTMSVSVSTFLADQAVLNKTAVANLTVADTSATLGANLAALRADVTNIDALTATDSVLTVNVANFVADQTLLNKTVGGFAVTDTVASIQANLGALNADAAHIIATTATGGTVSVNIASFTNNQAGLNDIVGGFNVADVVTNVQANLSTLLTDTTHINAITVQYGTVSTSIASFRTYQGVLNEIVGGFKVSDTVATIQANLGALNADAALISTTTATGGQVNVDIGTFGAFQPALNDIVGGFAVTDTVANVQANLAALNADAAHITSTTATGGPVSVSVSTFLADQAALNDIVGGFNVSDTSANLQTNLSALQADAANVDAITATSGVVTVNAATFVAYKTLLNKTVGGFSVADTAAVIQTNLAALQADVGHVNAITATGGVPAVSASTFVADQAALNEIVGGFNLSDAVTNLTTNLAALNAAAANIDSITALYGTYNATVATLQADQAALNKIVGGVKVVDTGADIQANLTFLQGDAANIGAIQLSSGTLLVSTSAFLADQTALNKIASGFAVVDTSANIQAQIAALQSDAAAVTSVTLSDSTAATPAGLSLTAANAASDAAILAKIVSPYVLDTTANGTMSVTGHGNGLTINVGSGASVVTGGGLNETLIVGSNFGSMQITDFATHCTDTSHDTISLSTTDFGNWTTLVSEGQSSGAGNANTTFTAADGASLTINGIALSTFQHPSAALIADFTFHA